jgi:hypothetical protein
LPFIKKPVKPLDIRSHHVSGKTLSPAYDRYA